MSQSIHEFYEYIITELYKKDDILPQYIGYDKTQYSDGVYIRFVLNNSVHNIHIKFDTIEYYRLKYNLKYRIDKINKIKDNICSKSEKN